MGWADNLASVDRAALDLLAEEITYTPGGEDPETVNGIFDALYIRVDANFAGATSSGPSVFLLLSDLSNDPETDPDARITVAETEYRVWKYEKDGQGGIRLLLHET